MDDQHRSWLEVIPPVIDAPPRRRERGQPEPSYVNWPGWKKAIQFDQCYAVILRAVALKKPGTVYIYRQWIEDRLGPPYDKMIRWAEDNGWPIKQEVWARGWR